MFDSHCRSSHGITDSPFGFSVLLQFLDLIQIERYIEEAYKVPNLAYPPYSQIQFISVNVNDLDLRAIQSCHVNLFGSTKRKGGYKKVLQMYLKKTKTESNKTRKCEGKNEDNTTDKRQFL